MNIGWLILILYVCGFLYTSRAVALAVLDSDAKFMKNLWKDSQGDRPLVSNDDRMTALLVGFGAGLIWPVALIFMFLSKKLVSPTEIIHRQEQELKVLREQAKRLDLPMPEVRDR